MHLHVSNYEHYLEVLGAGGPASQAWSPILLLELRTTGLTAEWSLGIIRCCQLLWIG